MPNICENKIIIVLSPENIKSNEKFLTLLKAGFKNQKIPYYRDEPKITESDDSITIDFLSSFRPPIQEIKDICEITKNIKIALAYYEIGTNFYGIFKYQARKYEYTKEKNFRFEMNEDDLVNIKEDERGNPIVHDHEEEGDEEGPDYQTANGNFKKFLEKYDFEPYVSNY